MLATLMFATLVIAAVVGIAQFFWFMRRSRNRDIAAEALVGDGRHRSESASPDGALPEIVGLGAVGLLAMAMLLFGYSRQGFESAKYVSPPAEARSSPTATEPMTQPTLPRTNPADMPNPPTTFPNASGNPSDPTKGNSP